MHAVLLFFFFIFFVGMGRSNAETDKNADLESLYSAEFHKRSATKMSENVLYVIDAPFPAFAQG